MKELGSHKLGALHPQRAIARFSGSQVNVEIYALTVPFTLLWLGVVIEPSAGRKTTRIFRS